MQFLNQKNPAANISTDVVKKQDIKRTVLATGQVTSQTDLALSFRATGVLSKINVKEGDKVKQGDVLALLDQRDQLASLTSARGALAQAQANYQRVIAGSSVEDITVTQVAYENAKSVLDSTQKQQQVLVDNSYKALLNSGLAAVAGPGNTGSVTVTVSGAYVGKELGIYKISIYAAGSGLRYQVSGLESADGQVDITPQPIGTKGLFIQFSDRSVPTNNVWTIKIPNDQSTTYLTNYNAYQAALETQRSALASAQNAVDSAQALLNLKKAQARPADVQAADAQILTAQGQILSAQAAYDNTVLRAPTGGVITRVDIKLGEQVTALKEAMVLQDVNNLHIEANVSEASITKPTRSLRSSAR